MAGRATKRSESRRKPRQSTVKQKTVAELYSQPPAYTVFISHSSKESWIAKQIAKEIETLGARTWLDLKYLHGGDEIRRSIERGIRTSHEAIVLLSANSITSQWVIYEVGAAHIQRKRVTPILNNLAPDETLEPLKGIKALDLNDFDKFLVELAERIKKHLGNNRKAAI
jgi:hypothetical protein